MWCARACARVGVPLGECVNGIFRLSGSARLRAFPDVHV